MLCKVSVPFIAEKPVHLTNPRCRSAPRARLFSDPPPKVSVLRKHCTTCLSRSRYLLVAVPPPIPSPYPQASITVRQRERSTLKYTVLGFALFGNSLVAGIYSAVTIRSNERCTFKHLTSLVLNLPYSYFPSLNPPFLGSFICFAHAALACFLIQHPHSKYLNSAARTSTSGSYIQLYPRR